MRRVGIAISLQYRKIKYFSVRLALSLFLKKMRTMMNEFESWDEYDEYIREASSDELHTLLVEHAKCWPEGFCEMEAEFIEELEDNREAIVIKVLGSKSVGAQSLEVALENGSSDGEYALTLTYAAMASPAINKELLLKTPAWDHQQAWWIMNHELADADVIKNLEETHGYSLSETISRIMYMEQNDEVDVYLTGGQPKEYGTPEREAELLAKIYAKTNGPEGLE
jgi:hypothetical protein